MNHQIIDDHRTTLSAEDLADLRENLLEQLLFRREQLHQLSTPAADRADALRDRGAASQTEVRVKLAASARMVLTDVEAALARMDRGSYGLSSRTVRAGVTSCAMTEQCQKGRCTPPVRAV
ncbi:hypothetical protein AB0G81_21035, partial [Streptomyces asoensis]|uniref:hypothetical protein n=1 Tax=Streptomyces asoensis TaxID=249586 RepID=UPI0033E16741